MPDFNRESDRMKFLLKLHKKLINKADQIDILINFIDNNDDRHQLHKIEEKITSASYDLLKLINNDLAMIETASDFS